MKTHLISCLVLVALSLPLSGCPGASSIALGQWLIAMDASVGLFGVAFLADGQVDLFDSNNKPPGATAVYGGVMTWEQNGNDIAILQDGAAFDRIFNDTLEGRTYITGTWMNFNGSNATGTFVASKSPYNL